MMRSGDNMEIIEDFLINVFREFSKKGFADFSTGFQRYYVRDVIKYLDIEAAIEYGNIDMSKLVRVCKDRGFYSEERGDA